MWVGSVDPGIGSGRALGDPEPVEAAGGPQQVGQRAFQLGLGRALGQQGLHVLEGAAELVQAILQAVELGAGHQDDVTGKAGLRRSRPLLVSALPAGLAAVEPWASDGTCLREHATAPAAATRLLTMARDGDGAIGCHGRSVRGDGEVGERVLGSHVPGR